MVKRVKFFALAAAVAFALVPAPSMAMGLLSHAQLNALKRLPFRAVVPDEVPRGFRLVFFRVTPRSPQSYVLAYRRSDGAYLIFAGQAAPAGSSSQEYAEAFAQRMRQSGAAYASGSGYSGQFEARQTNADAQANNDDVGAASFTRTGNCYLGYADPTQSTISNAVFAAEGCGLGEQVELLTQGYQELTPVR
jgi:hypothetical protein